MNQEELEKWNSLWRNLSEIERNDLIFVANRDFQLKPENKNKQFYTQPFEILDPQLQEKLKPLIEKKNEENEIDYQTDQFYHSIVDYGSSDIYTAIKVFHKVGLEGSELADRCREFCEDNDQDLAKLDVCYIAYDHILQSARNKISEVLDFDIANDIKGGTEFYVYGNYMCTSFDFSQEAVSQLQEKLNEVTQEQLDELKEDQFVKFFLGEVGIELPKEAKKDEDED